jgi:transcriptional regulator with XRE-family HTH domain
MPGRSADLLAIEDSFWERASVIEALRRRDIGHLFRLLAQYAGVSQTRLAIACDTTQPKVSGYMRGTARVEALEMFERIADGLNMPDHARNALGIAPKLKRAVAVEPDIPSRNTRQLLPAAVVPGLLSAEVADGEENESVRRRTFVGLTGASLFGMILADPTRNGPADAIESFAAVLATYAPATTGADLDAPPDVPSLATAVARAKRDYQACRYSTVATDLPGLLSRLQTACAVLQGQAKRTPCPPKRTTSRRASCSRSATRAWAGWPPTAACRPRRRARTR